MCFQILNSADANAKGLLHPAAFWRNQMDPSRVNISGTTSRMIPDTTKAPMPTWLKNATTTPPPKMYKVNAKIAIKLCRLQGVGHLLL